MNKYLYFAKTAFFTLFISVLAVASSTVNETLKGIIYPGSYGIKLSENQIIDPYTIASGVNITLSSEDGKEYAIELSSSAGAMFTVNAGASLTLEEGITLKGRSATTYPVVLNEGEFVMNGGTITGNVNNSGDGTRRAGGVSVNNGGVFIMNGGEINNNTFSGSGIIGGAGAVLVYSLPTAPTDNQSKFIMKDGIITGNTNSAMGGSNNGAGGVYVSDALFEMEGGTISNNQQTGTNVPRGGGGVYLANTSRFTMSGGTIEDNTAVGTLYKGSGVYVNQTSRIYFSGKPIIKDGIFATGELSQRLFIEGNFEENALVTIEGYTAADLAPGNNVTGAFADLNETTAKAFASKDGTLFGVKNGNRVIWGRYSISLSETGTYNFAAANYGYAAQVQTVTVTNTGGYATGNLTVAFNNGNFEILNNDAALGIAAMNETATFQIAPKKNLSVGTYTATVTVSGQYNISESFDVSFTVNKAPLTLRVIDTTIYVGSPEPASYFYALTVLMNEDTKETAINASELKFALDLPFNNSTEGKFIVTPSGATANNYEIMYKTGTLTVSSKISVDITIDLPDITYGEEYSDPAVKVDGNPVTDFDKVSYIYEGTTYEGIMGDGSHYGPTKEKPANPGEYTVTVVYQDESHYGSKTEHFTIEKKSLSWRTASVQTKPYDGKVTAYISAHPALSGVISGDIASVVYGTATFKNADVAKDIPIIALDYGIAGNDAWKYNAPSEQPKFNDGEIVKATAPSNITTAELIFFEAGEQTINLDSFLPVVVGNYGTINYPKISLETAGGFSPYIEDIENGLMLINVTDAGNATIIVTIESRNYEDFTITVPVKSVSGNGYTNVSSNIAFESGSASYNGQEQEYKKATIETYDDDEDYWTYTYTTVDGMLQNEKPFGAGSYTVTAIYENGTYLGSKYATFTIYPAEQNIAFVRNPINKAYGDVSFTNSVINLPADGGAITYSSNDTTIATVNPNTGEVTILGAGETAIIAVAATVSGKYRKSSIVYTLIVEKAKQDPPDLSDLVEIPNTESSIALGITDIAKYQKNDCEWEYSIDHGQTWKCTPDFGQLNSNWEYTILIRKKETDNFFASEPVEVIFRTIREPIFAVENKEGMAKFSMVAPNMAKTDIAVYDIKGNIVFRRSNVMNGEKITWNIAKGMYFIVTTAIDENGKIHRYSSKIGVRK
ncbi:MAG: YDG domain-containing protein [Fibromonadales bacterium]|nr:YDG domain-containing protein [Fibromonadales bacterium]